jgi:hypothetical protein
MSRITKGIAVARVVVAAEILRTIFIVSPVDSVDLACWMQQ